jgi:F-type H+-transporting ATPase subunit b
VQIDWLTVGAQWVNFLILMWLLRRYLYQPILRAMDKRQQAIATRTAAAISKTEQAEQLARDYRDKLAELEARRAELLVAARADADAERTKLMEQARADAKAESEQWRRDLAREKSDFQTQINRQLGGLITATARKAVEDLCSKSLEQALCDQFLERLQQLPTVEKCLFTEPIPGELVLASSFELDLAQRNRFDSALRDILASDVSLRFETLRNSSFGVALSSADHTLEWQLERYFTELQAELDTTLIQTERKPPAQAETPSPARLANAEPGMNVECRQSLPE